MLLERSWLVKYNVQWSRIVESLSTNATIERLRQQIAGVNYVCSGTLMRRTKTCGNPGCRCAKDPSARHGPYYEWRRREGNRYVHTVVSKQQALEIARAIRNDRKVRRLLRRWEEESARQIKRLDERKK